MGSWSQVCEVPFSPYLFPKPTRLKTRGGSFESGLNFLTKKVSSVSPAYDFSQGKNLRELFFSLCSPAMYHQL